MQWLNKIVDEIIARKPDGEILIESGTSPSGTYHLGHLREILICDAILLELQNRGRQAKHVHFVDDLDALRKIPVNIPPEYEKYLGIPLCDIPSPEGTGSYADYFLNPFLASAATLGIRMEVIRSHEKYRSGFFAPAIEKTLDNISKVRQILEEISGRKLNEQWLPIQVMEDEYLKNRSLVGIDTNTKAIVYKDKDGNNQTVSYADGKVKLDWRLDWPARWWLLKIDVEPAGRDHATKGSSFDTGLAIDKEIFSIPGPLPIAYDFVNRAGDTKKMSASKGTGISISEVTTVLPPEIVRFFMLRYEPDKRLYFDTGEGAMRLFDEFAKELDEHPEDPLTRLAIAPFGNEKLTISRIPFSHLVASYQAALKDPAKTLDIIARTEHRLVAQKQEEIVKAELQFIDQWLQKWAPEDVKFELAQEVKPADFSESEKTYLKELADKIDSAPENADGDWFHKAIYEFKTDGDLSPQQLFSPLYRALIGKESGPRAGWFLSILQRDWLIKRLRFES